MAERLRNTFTTQYESWDDMKEVSFIVGQNHENYVIGRDNGLYLELEDSYGHTAYAGMDVDNIPGIIEALQAVYDKFEAHKPKQQVGEMLDAYPDGTTIKFDRDYGTTYVKIGGKWVDPRHGLTGHTFRDGWDAADWKFTVKYNPKEAN